MKNLKANLPLFLEDSLVPYARWSFIVHFFIALSIIFVPRVFDLGQEMPKITQVVSAIRVDLVAMPKYTLRELKKLSAAASAAKIIPTKDKGPTYLKKGKQKSLKDLLRGEAGKELSVKAKGKTKKTAKRNKYAKELGGLILQGNKISKGWAIVGDTREMILDEFGKYMASLPDYIRPNWKLPANLMKKKLNCRVQVFIGSKGELKKAKMFKSSGNGEYDRKAMEAVRETSFPIPSKNIKEKARKGQILLGFPL
ncbi:MAG: TonB family protein [Deltaproteobacteria bacterium]|nr:MAG: TonB family protein [Deltaproteobacteria bacterium]